MRKIIVILAACTVILLLGYSGYRAFELWKQSHGLALAKQFSAKGDADNEALALEQVLHANPRNLEANRMMANLADGARWPTALSWRQKVVELAPDSVNDRLLLAQTALFFHDPITSSNALA